ncbi:hypothetical protein GCM10022261_11390 [Brevibacterium daeguense]|uniref:Uncharacterized protein n=1 Tax=Brevibacterium daeguense TaxID=909936 RepID=A0ABP8EI28_9MICO|nr:hypothetical protein [Brevibacterium daeguense]
MAHEITVTGGSGGTRAAMEDLDALAAELLRIADELAGVLMDATVRELDPVLEASALASPATAFAVQRESAAFAFSAAGVSARLALLGTGLAHAVLSYRETEGFLSRTFEAVLSGMGNLLGHAARTALMTPAVIVGAGFVGGAIYVIDRTGLDDALEEALGIDLSEVTDEVLQGVGRALFAESDSVGVVIEHVLPGFVAGFAGVPPGIHAGFGDAAPWPHDSQSLTEMLIGGGRLAGQFGRTGVEVSAAERPQPPGGTRAAPANAVELFSRELDSHRGLDNGMVQIERIESADGTTRWIVYVPATTDWSTAPGANSTDLTTNVEGAAGHDTVMREVIRQAVADAGIAADEEVMLVGYSQGGLTAASLAADPGFLADVNVTALFTVASPVSDFDIPPEVSTLSIEHEQDLVPDLDGNQNPDHPHWSTITVDLDFEALADDPMFEGMTDEEIGQRLASPGFPHGGAVYETTIASLYAGGNAALLAWSARSAGFFSGEVTRTREYTGRRR